MEQNTLYNQERVDSREDFFKGNYDLSMQEFGALFFQTIYDLTPNGGSILELGTGNGFILEQLSLKYPDRFSLFGLDISPEMVEQARERLRNISCSLQIGDNEDLDFGNESFDTVTAKNVTNFSSEEVYRVLKSEGHFVFREYGKGKGLVEIAELFPDRLVRSRDPHFYVGQLQNVGFRDIVLAEKKVVRNYTFEELFKVLKMFPFIEDYSQEDWEKIKSKYSNSSEINITSDSILITARK